MSKIIIHTHIDAPIERVFDLSTSIDLHKISALKSKEQAIAGITQGLIKLNESVTWKAKHFGIWHKMKVTITEHKRPTRFIDEMVSGSFKFLKHQHEYENEEGRTVMIDTFEFTSPFGWFGKIVDKLILKNYMTTFLKERNQIIKEFAETEKWRQVL